MSDGTKRLFAVDELALNVVSTRSFGQSGDGVADRIGEDEAYQIGGT